MFFFIWLDNSKDILLGRFFGRVVSAVKFNIFGMLGAVEAHGFNGVNIQTRFAQEFCTDILSLVAGVLGMPEMTMAMRRLLPNLQKCLTLLTILG